MTAVLRMAALYGSCGFEARPRFHFSMEVKLARVVYNRHLSDFRCDFTLEFNVKGINEYTLPEDLWNYEWETGAFTNTYGRRCFDEIAKLLKRIKSWSADDWSFAGRTNGWFVLLCSGDEEKVTALQEDKLEIIVDFYKGNYNRELERFYSYESMEIEIDHA